MCVCVCLAHRVGSQDVQVWLVVSLQQQPQCAEETLHQQVDALAVAGQQQLLHGLQGDAHVPAHTTRVSCAFMCVCTGECTMLVANP